jgi:hypothetical protein
MMVLIRLFFFVISAALLSSCEKKSQFADCNNLLGSTCPSNGRGDYCLFGYKWGRGNPLNASGLEGSGPRIPGGLITFRFLPSDIPFSTHSQENLTSKSFDNYSPCAKDEIRKALQAWENIANLSFEEIDDDMQSDITFITGDIEQSGLGYPPFTENECIPLSGQIILQYGQQECPGIYALALHEIGHCLGLGHVLSPNIMNPNYIGLTELQSGDSAGILAIYGQK